MKYPAKLGIVAELCGGFVDKKLTLKETVKEKIMEQGGFNVSHDSLEEVMTYRQATKFY